MSAPPDSTMAHEQITRSHWGRWLARASQVLREHNVLALNYLAQHVTSSRLHTFRLYSHQEGKQCRNLYFLPSSLAAFSLQLR